MKPSSTFNQNGVKDSINQYRNIKGVYYICWTSDNNLFDIEKQKAKEERLKTKIINGELYKEVKI